MNAVASMTGNGRNKLRTYKPLKYCAENYCKVLVPFNGRNAFAKFKCGVALKKYSDSQCCWKKYSDFGGGKKK